VRDTLFLEPDAGRFTLTWRACVPLEKNILEIAHILVGRFPEGWYRARRLNKSYYTSLAALGRGTPS
jgi:hypothetical protein